MSTTTTTVAAPASNTTTTDNASSTTTTTTASSSSETAQKEKFMAKMKRKTTNAGHATKLQAYKTKRQAQNQILKRQIADRKRSFGVEYMDLKLQARTTRTDLQTCLATAVADVRELQASIDQNLQKINDKEEVVRKERIQQFNPNAVSPPPPPSTTPQEQPLSLDTKKQQKATKANPQGGSSGRGGRGAQTPLAGRAGRSAPQAANQNGHPTSPGNHRDKGRASPPGRGGRGPSTGRGRGGGNPNNSLSRNKNNNSNNNNNNNKSGVKAAPAGGGLALMAVSAPEEYRNVDTSQWKLSHVKFNGSTSHQTCGTQEKVSGQSIPQVIKHFKANPSKYVALYYQSSMVDWPADQHQCTLVHREGTSGFAARDVGPSGWMTMHKYDYERLPVYKDNQLPKAHRDEYTDNMTFGGRKLHSKKNPPIMPGRGMGVGDTPLLKVIGDVDPSDIHQGQVGDCWLLSAISAVAEFDGAIKRLYRKTPDLDNMPHADKPNTYTLTLWDLTTWKEVDIVIDERLCAAPDGRLLASKPSEDGELWVCYIEKAIACLAGGWDKLVGGQCTQAWAMLTGCKEQYMIMKNSSTGKYRCYGRYNSNEGRWARHANCPHEGEIGMWPMPWPKVGGGGSAELELTQDELFLRLVAWDQVNYIVGAGTSGTSDKNSTDGLVDNHAYSVIESRDNVAGTGIGLLKVRNPWGSGEIEDGEFDDDGPGWDKYPQIKKELNPVVADDGIFWVTKKEFFQMYSTIYLSASNMTEYLED